MAGLESAYTKLNKNV